MRFPIQNAGRSFPGLNLLIEQAPRSERLLPRAAARWLPMVVARIRTNPLALAALLLMASAATLCFAQSPGNGGSLTGKPGLPGQQAPVVSLAPNESRAPIYPREPSDKAATAGAGPGSGSISAHHAPNRHHSTARGSHTMRCARRAATQQSTSIEASAISNVPGRSQTAWASAIPQAKSHAA
jgi:hypothetical protein